MQHASPVLHEYGFCVQATHSHSIQIPFAPELEQWNIIAIDLPGAYPSHLPRQMHVIVSAYPLHTRWSPALAHSFVCCSYCCQACKYRPRLGHSRLKQSNFAHAVPQTDGLARATGRQEMSLRSHAGALASRNAPQFAMLRSIQLCASLAVHTAWVSDDIHETGGLPTKLASTLCQVLPLTTQLPHSGIDRQSSARGTI